MGGNHNNNSAREEGDKSGFHIAVKTPQKFSKIKLFPVICVAVFCDEKEVPPFNNGTGKGTTNLKELKTADPVRWNSWRKRQGNCTYVVDQIY
jgi:hypothetical protein